MGFHQGQWTEHDNQRLKALVAKGASVADKMGRHPVKQMAKMLERFQA
jgi:hypothetical protein